MMKPMATHTPGPGNITLIGMPGVGKSTLGVLLAKHLCYGFVDTDLLIQTGENAGLQQIIGEKGIEAFCRIEAGYILKFKARKTVIATGGSVVYNERAMMHLADVGRILFLDIELAPLTQRLNNLDSRGVVLMPGQSLDQLYAQRRPMYQRHAHLTVDCTGQSPDQLVRRMVAALKKDPLFSG